MLSRDEERQRIRAAMHRIIADPRHGKAIREDLEAGFSALPIWMQEFLRGVLGDAAANRVRS